MQTDSHSQTNRTEEEEEVEEEEDTFLKERAGRAGGRSLTWWWWWNASKCIDRCCPTGGDTAGLTERDAHRPQTSRRRRAGGDRGEVRRRTVRG